MEVAVLLLLYHMCFACTFKIETDHKDFLNVVTQMILNNNLVSYYQVHVTRNFLSFNVFFALEVIIGATVTKILMIHQSKLKVTY